LIKFKGGITMTTYVVVGEDDYGTIEAEFSELNKAKALANEIKSKNGCAVVLTKCETEDLPF